MNLTLVISVALHVIALIVLQFVQPGTHDEDDEDILAKEEKKPKIVKFEPIEDKKPEPKPAPKPEPKKAPPRSSAPMASQSSQPTNETTHVDLTVGLDPNSFGGEGIVVPSGETLIGNVGDMAGPPAMAPPPMTPPPPPVVITVKTMPRVLSVPRMPYPEEARRRGIQGEIHVLVTVDVEGRVVGTELKKSVDPKLDGLAMDALKKARFAPAVGSDGNPMRYTLMYRYVFRLEDEE